MKTDVPLQMHYGGLALVILGPIMVLLGGGSFSGREQCQELADRGSTRRAIENRSLQESVGAASQPHEFERLFHRCGGVRICRRWKTIHLRPHSSVV